VNRVKVYPMLTENRRRAIFDLVREQGSVSVKELSDRFEVSPMTVYRDLKALEAKDTLQRVRGGAIHQPSSPEEPRFGAKIEVQRRSKLAIARYAATHFVGDKDIVVLEAGTTVAAIVRFLPLTLSALIANGLDALNEARALLPAVPVFGCGGMLRSPSFTFVGPEAEAYFRSITATTLFLGATGLTLEEGITDPNPLEIEVKRAMAACAQRTVLLIDGSKFGRRSLRQILPLEEVDALVTDSGAPISTLREVEALGVEVHVTEVDEAPTGIEPPSAG
jgi:DeoR/GlpR family transcriptional regulator of sugar metabolism